MNYLRLYVNTIDRYGLVCWNFFHKLILCAYHMPHNVYLLQISTNMIVLFGRAQWLLKYLSKTMTLAMMTMLMISTLCCQTRIQAMTSSGTRRRLLGCELETRPSKYISRMLLTFPHAENSCEINPSHMVFMICNFAHYI